MTPLRMVELECPTCGHYHWELDHDHLGTMMDEPYEGRIYRCPQCGESTVGFRVRQGSPPTFFLQPHYLAMTPKDFTHWLKILRREFPSKSFFLDSVGVYWYPGDDTSQEHALRRAAHIGTVNGYSLHVANRSPDDERIRVCVQGPGEAYYWCGSDVELERCVFGFQATDLDEIRLMLIDQQSDIRRAWNRFSEQARVARARWVPILGLSDEGPVA